MSYDVYWVKNRAEKITDFEHPTCKGSSNFPFFLNDFRDFRDFHDFLSL